MIWLGNFSFGIIGQQYGCCYYYPIIDLVLQNFLFVFFVAAAIWWVTFNLVWLNKSFLIVIAVIGCQRWRAVFDTLWQLLSSASVLMAMSSSNVLEKLMFEGNFDELFDNLIYFECFWLWRLFHLKLQFLMHLNHLQRFWDFEEVLTPEKECQNCWVFYLRLSF